MGLIDLVGTTEIADRLGVVPMTVHTWRQRKRLEFPEPDYLVSTMPAWEWITVREWAEKSGRLAVESTSGNDYSLHDMRPDTDEPDPVPSDLRYRVLAASGGRCALCGATSKERRIEVGHVVPRSKDGSNDIENLQALCDECNRGKSNRDDTRFSD